MDQTTAGAGPAPRAESAAPGRWSLRQLCRATRFEVFREDLNSVFCPAKVEVRERAAPVLPSSRLSAAKLRHLTVGHVCFHGLGPRSASRNAALAESPGVSRAPRPAR
ncbi:hypothetical protein AB0K15_42295 [Amycolatopsis sp. NPDC049253]|uniref:hypothetical protein n=1 Tax=Amycolatopsis sp. NPDC049253 TaxID=3155274 RepID=UPI00341E4460